MNLRILTIAFALISTLSAATPSAEKVFPYGQFKGHPVQLVVLPDSRVMLRVGFSPSPVYDTPNEQDEALTYLKQEVIRITSAGRPLAVDGSGYLLNFQSGHPIWGPSRSIGSKGDNFHNLLFAEHAVIVGNEIRAMGTKEVEGYDGYTLWPKPPRK